MGKKQKWQRSDTISIIALLLAIPAIIFSSIEFFEKRNESIEIIKLESKQKYWHISEVTRTKKNLYVSEILEWQKIRISNKSDFPITITNSFLKIDNDQYKNSISPFFENIRYTDSNVSLENPVDLPLKIEANSVQELFYPLLIPIDSTMGMALLLTSFNPENMVENSSLSAIMFNGNYFKEFADIFDSKMDSSQVKKKLGIDVSINSFHKIQVSRNLIQESASNYELIDKENKAKDGFVYLEKSNCLLQISELLLEYDKPNQTNFKNIKGYFKTLENNEYFFEYSNTDFRK